MMKWRGPLAVAVALALASELLARHFVAFPLYAADPKIGYFIRPNQSGHFLANAWAFDSDGLGVAEPFAPSQKQDVLLVGDSIVLGGNPFDQKEKLGPVLQEKTHWAVWPASAGSWALQNELAFLDRDPRLVAGSDLVVFVLNSGDFDLPSEWRSELTHPTHKPAVYLPYLVNRYLLKPSYVPQAPMPVRKVVLADAWEKFFASWHKRVVVIVYENKLESASHCNFVPRQLLNHAAWYCYNTVKNAGLASFRDDIHPDQGGTRVLANYIVNAVKNRAGDRIE